MCFIGTRTRDLFGATFVGEFPGDKNIFFLLCWRLLLPAKVKKNSRNRQKCVWRQGLEEDPYLQYDQEGEGEETNGWPCHGVSTRSGESETRHHRLISLPRSARWVPDLLNDDMKKSKWEQARGFSGNGLPPPNVHVGQHCYYVRVGNVLPHTKQQSKQWLEKGKSTGLSRPKSTPWENADGAGLLQF